MNIQEVIALTREEIRGLVPYSSARDEYSGPHGVFLDANENPFESGLNRYPDPSQSELRKYISGVRNISPENIIAGNGSDEIIDLVFRLFCKPAADNIITLPPTYGMYSVSAAINQVENREVMLTENFRPDLTGILNAADKNTRLLFICSPNNPSGNLVPKEDVLFLLENFKGVVIVDEAYIDFCPEGTLLKYIDQYPNLIILQTLSKAWGLAGIRLGMMMANKEIIGLIRKIKSPYNINLLTQQAAIRALKNSSQKETWVNEICQGRIFLANELSGLNFVKKIYRSDANFLLVRFENPDKVLNYLYKKKIIVRDRSHVPLCNGCLRISVGTPEENQLLIKELRNF